MSSVEKLLSLPNRIFRGHLAEEYDGIGQYVLVSLSLGSVSNAYKARIASGDFGGGRRFPIGTPVVIFSNRGQLEVHLGNQPKTCLCLETFNRIEVDGVGSNWIPIDPADFIGSANGTHAVLDLSGTSYIGRRFSGIRLPIEILSEYQFRGKDPFLHWSGTGAGTSDFGTNFNISQEGFNFSGTRVDIDHSLSGAYPATQLGFAVTDTRDPIPGNIDFDDIALPWSLDTQLNGPFLFRFYVDDHGVYGRFWKKGESEPKNSGPELVPFYSDPGLQAQWLAGKWGKGEAWSAYRASLNGYTDPLPATWNMFVTSGFGRMALHEIDKICFIQGMKC